MWHGLGARGATWIGKGSTMKLPPQLTIITAGLLAGGSVGALYQAMASAEAARRVETALARLPGVHAGSVSVDPWTGRIALTDLSGEANGVRFHTGKAVLRTRAGALAALVSPAFAADETVAADNI